ncbi:hypothetical protein U3516DRAFT_910023 [Neocallimastix sp. 'constans']
MTYCCDYSMIILNRKLLYKDHKTKTSAEIKYYFEKVILFIQNRYRNQRHYL